MPQLPSGPITWIHVCPSSLLLKEYVVPSGRAPAIALRNWPSISWPSGRRSGKAEEIAYTALFLASDESSYITGTDIVVDGGWFSSAPYLGNKRSHHMLTLLKAKEEIQEKKDEVQGFLRRFL
jgi:hypothetical protein